MVACDYNKLKTNLNLIMHRLKLVERKKIEQNAKARRTVAELITNNKIDRARIKVEQIVLQDFLVEAMDMIEQFCDLILSRYGLVKGSDAMDEGLQVAIASVIWVAPRLESEVPELKVISDQFGLKYGKKYVEAIRENQLKNVSESLMKKMGIHAPSKLLVENYMVEIAKDQKVDYNPDPKIMKEAETSNLSSSFDRSSDDDDTGGTHVRNLIDLGDHYPINPLTNAFSPYGNPPPVPDVPPATAPSRHLPGPDISAINPSTSLNIGFNLADDYAVPLHSTRSSIDFDNISKKKHSQLSLAPSENISHRSSNETIPPHYDTVVDGVCKSETDVSQYHSFSSDRLNDTLPELPPVPKDLPSNLNVSDATENTDDTVDFDLLARRFEDLKSKNP